jgi:hypothetical protein
MTQPNVTDSDGAIRITAADAASAHVDDLLRRQASLRGDTGITRDKGRRWYYQNWFVLMLAGFLAAFLGWAMIEPVFDDLAYIEGTVRTLTPGNDGHAQVLGHVTVGNQPYLLLTVTRTRNAAGKWVPFTMDDIRPGQYVGIYAEVPDNQQDIEVIGKTAFAAYVVPDAPPTGVGDDLPTQMKKKMIGGLLLFPVVAGMVGLFIGAADGLMCRLLRRALLAGGIGLITGIIGGFIFMCFAGLVYSPINHWAENQTGTGAGGMTTLGFLTQIGGRGLAWALAGIAMGLGQGLALRSGKIVIYGLLGGLFGGLFGGLLFDPIYFFVTGEHNPSAYLSRMISLSLIGGSVGLMIGIVELLARDAWLRMVAGPLAGKEFLIFKSTMNVGASPKSDIYLFNDEAVAPTHAVIRATGDLYEIESVSGVYPLTVNGRTVSRTRLRHGDQIALGRTIFAFQRKRG